MSTRLLSSAISGLLLLFCIVNPSSATEASRLVLVTGSDATAITQFTPAQLRKLFLGLTNGHKDGSIRPLRNMSDERLYNVFLQKVVFMSARNYERHLLSRVISMGGQRPPSYASQTELIQKLRSNPHSLSYMWEKTARNTPGIKILQKLW